MRIALIITTEFEVLVKKWCPDPFFRVVIHHFESLRGLPLYFWSQTSRCPLPVPGLNNAR